MPFIASIFFERPGAPKDMKNIQIGSLFYDDNAHRASLLLTGFYTGQWAAVPYAKYKELCADLDLSGDIMIRTGEYESGGLNRVKYQWAGMIQSSNDERGTVYWGVLEVLPLQAMADAVKDAVVASINGEVGKRTGMWLNIFLTNDDKHGYIKPGMADVFKEPAEAKATEDDDLPF